ncbi:MAG: hypothetical protein Tsb0021_11660 [Chlamydiales bacterium]
MINQLKILIILGISALIPFMESQAAIDFYSCEECIYDPLERFCCPCLNNDFVLSADFLLWKLCQNDRDYAISSNNTISASGTQNLRYQFLDPSWEPGVRGCIKKINFWCGWDLSGSYTYIHPTESSEISSTIPGSITSTLFSSHFNLDNLLSAKANMKLEYSSFDVLFSRDFTLSDCHTLTPFIGMEGLFTEERLSSKIRNEEETASLNWKSDYWGAGLKIGTTYFYNLSQCFSLFAKGSLSLIYGEVCSENRQSIVSEEINSELKYKSDRMGNCMPGWHLASGLSYEQILCGCSVHWRLGYEFVQWANFPNLRRYTTQGVSNLGISTSSHTRFGFQGLLAGVKVKF